MVRAEQDKLLGANLPRRFVDDFWEKAAAHGENKTQVVKAMAQLWLDLPDDVKQNYLYPKKEGQSISALVQNIVASQLSAFRAALSPAQRKIVDKKLKETREKIAQTK